MVEIKLTLWMWQKCMPFSTCQTIRRTVSSWRPEGLWPRSSSTVWSTYSNTRYRCFLRQNTSIRFTRFSCRNCFTERTQNRQTSTTVFCDMSVALVALCNLFEINIHVMYMVVLWRFGAVGSDVGQINEVTLRLARLVLGWVTVSGFNSRCGKFILV